MTKEQNNKTPMLDLFQDWTPTGDLADYAACSGLSRVVISKKERRLTADMFCDRNISASKVQQMEQALKQRYGLQAVKLHCAAATVEAQLPNSLAQAEEERQAELRKILAAEQKIRVKKPEKAATAFVFGSGDINLPVTEISDVSFEKRGLVVIEGEAFSGSWNTTRQKGIMVRFNVGSEHGAIRVIKFLRTAEGCEELTALVDSLEKGSKYVRLAGRVQPNRFDHEMELDLEWLTLVKKEIRPDTAEEKRVELHLHTNMSELDALTKVGDYIARAAHWGHKAIAVTDHAVVHSFPDAYSAGKRHGVKIMYGMEAYFVNDMDDRLVVNGTSAEPLDGTFVVFDVETTGLHARHGDRLTEIGAVKLVGGEIVDTFNTFVDPEQRLTQKIVNLTKITDEDLISAPKEQEALERFLAFAGEAPLVGHNVLFDMGFLYEAAGRCGMEIPNASVDTLPLAQNLLPKLSKYSLDSVATFLRLPDFQHHRASDDARTTALALLRLFELAREKGVTGLSDMNPVMVPLRIANRDNVRRQPKHLIIFAKNQAGLRNLYKLISLSHLEYFKRYPLIPKSVLEENREGLIFGTACEAGELMRSVLDGRPAGELERVAGWYDYLEIQPICNNRFLIRDTYYDHIKTDEDLMALNRTIVALGEKLNKPVCATCDAHFLDPQQEIYRKIILAGRGFSDADEPLPIFFRNTEEMLAEFQYLGAEKAREVVIANTNLLADWVEDVRPLPEGLFTPKLENSEQELTDLVWGKTHELYGETPPELVQKRVEIELGDIISCKYDVIYMSAQKLVKNSLDAGYLVGSRGSVGSSVVAFMAGITEVNALPAHYRCPCCKHSDFDAGQEFGCGADMPDENCPVCGTQYVKDGFDIPFETFLGFGGDKVPDIDLNFSGEYQSKAHQYTFELFGKNHVFRAGTIQLLQSKTAYGYVKNYLSERNMFLSRVEEDYLTTGCTGVKRTTGQHPGGMVVIPSDLEVYDFCPVQNPPGKGSDHIITTHFDYHKMESNLLKLDLLGHDDPSMIRMLQDLTDVKPQEIPLDDEETMAIFTTLEPLKLLTDKRFTKKDEEILGQTGACAIPEFGTGFVRGMLKDTEPTDFDTLLYLSGFSHGTDVWLGNAQDLIKSGTASVREAIGCRDDIMRYLIRKGMHERQAFKIMEGVRKGKGLVSDDEQAMVKLAVPQWYIDSCKKIKYLFPRAHAVAYVMMAFRIAWFKVHHPIAFYAAYFSIRAKAFDATMMCVGIERVLSKMKEIESKGKEAGDVELNMMTTLEVCYEFYRRGFRFAGMSLQKSDAVNFLVTEDGEELIPPFLAIPKLGEAAADSIVDARNKGTFVAIDEFNAACPKVSKTHIEDLKAMGVFGNMPDERQFTLF